MTVAELLGRMSSEEFTEWRAEYAIEPWGPLRADLRAALVGLRLAQAAGTGGRWSLEDFLLKFGPPEKQGIDAMRMLLKGLADAAAATRKPGDPPPRRPRRRA
jgi:hypothetical protein